MRKFGIIAEGVTDQIVIENILLGYFDESGLDNDDIGYEQPLLDETDQKRAPEAAGWGMVFKYFELGKFKAAFQFYEHLIVQIDTDVSEQKGYDVPWREEGRELTPEELVARVVMRLTSLLSVEERAQYGERFIFAVAVHGIECWLLPLFHDSKKAEKTTGCLKSVDHELTRKNQPTLVKGEHKLPRSYAKASAPYAEPARLRKLYDKNPSLRIFVENLGALGSKAALTARP